VTAQQPADRRDAGQTLLRVPVESPLELKQVKARGAKNMPRQQSRDGNPVYLSLPKLFTPGRKKMAVICDCVALRHGVALILMSRHAAAA